MVTLGLSIILMGNECLYLLLSLKTEMAVTISLDRSRSAVILPGSAI